MRKLKKTATLTAPSLMIDDHIQMGGEMYRIHGLAKNAYGGWVIELYNIKDKDVRHAPRITVIVPADTSFVIYNQK